MDQGAISCDMWYGIVFLLPTASSQQYNLPLYTPVKRHDVTAHLTDSMEDTLMQAPTCK